MDVGLAAFNTETRWKANVKGEQYPIAHRSEFGFNLGHARWMLDMIQMNKNEWKNDKLNRWLGYAQAILVAHNVLSLEEVKQANKDA